MPGAAWMLAYFIFHQCVYAVELCLPSTLYDVIWDASSSMEAYFILYCMSMQVDIHQKAERYDGCHAIACGLSLLNVCM